MSMKFYNMREVVSHAKKNYGSRVFTSPDEYGLDPITYNELEYFVVCFSDFLKSCQAPEIERVAVISYNNSMTMLLCIGIMSCDRIYIPIDTSIAQADLIDYLDFLMPGLILCDPGHVDACNLWALPNGAKVVSLNNPAVFYRQIMSVVKPKSFKSKCCTSDVAAIAVHSSDQHTAIKNVLSQEKILNFAYSLILRCNLTSKDHSVVSAPINTRRMPIFASVCSLLVGASTTFIKPENTLTNLWNVAAKSKATWLILNSNMIEVLLETQPQATSLKGILISGTAVSTDLFTELKAKFSIEVYQAEGLNEVTATVSEPPDLEGRNIGFDKEPHDVPSHAVL